MEVMGTLFNLDNRIFSTLKSIVVPGKLTTEYFQGKHIRYYHPMRLFLFTGLALISAITVNYKHGEGYQKMEQANAEMEESYLQKKRNRDLEAIRQELNSKFKTVGERQAVDTFAYRAGFLDSMSMDRDSTSFSLFELKPTKFATSDLYELSPDSLANKYHVTKYWERLFLMQMARAQRGPNDFLLYLFSNVIWMLLFLIPLMALTLKLLYFRKPILFYEHLVFMLHLHAAAFIVHFVVIILPKEAYSISSTIAFLLGLVYPFAAMKRVYQQGFGKTLLKYMALGFSYLVFGSILIALLTVVSFALF